jgi:hypothetical protein
MKRIWCLIFGFIFSLSFLPGTARALELRFFGGAGNLSFDPKGEMPLGIRNAAFAPYGFPRGAVSLEGKFSDMVDFSAAYERDPVLGNRIFGSVGFKMSVFRLDFGPFVGLFNSGERALTPGIAAALALEFPGVIFGSLKAGSTLGSPASFAGDYLQQTGEFALGFWVPYVVCTLSINSRGFTRWKTGDLLMKDELIRYQFRADVFTKNVPYTIRIDMGYQSLKRSYMSSAGATADELKSIYIGVEGSYRIIPSLRLILGMEMPVFVWGVQPLKAPGKNTFLYQFGGGLIWTLPEKNSLRRE